jgi:hypothetical protein
MPSLAAGRGRLGLAVALGLIAGGADLADAPKLVEAQGFILRDAGGHQLASLRVNSAGLPTFDLYDRAGEARLGLGWDRERSVVSLCGRGGQRRLVLALGEADAPRLDLSDKDGRPLVLIGEGPGREAFLELDGPDERSGGIGMRLGRDGAASMEIESPRGKASIGLVAAPSGLATVAVSRDGRPDGTFGLLADGSCALKLFDGGGLRLTLGLDRTSSPGLYLYDKSVKAGSIWPWRPPAARDWHCSARTGRRLLTWSSWPAVRSS